MNKNFNNKNIIIENFKGAGAFGSVSSSLPSLRMNIPSVRTHIGAKNPKQTHLTIQIFWFYFTLGMFCIISLLIPLLPLLPVNLIFCPIFFMGFLFGSLIFFILWIVTGIVSKRDFLQYFTDPMNAILNPKFK